MSTAIEEPPLTVGKLQPRRLPTDTPEFVTITTLAKTPEGKPDRHRTVGIFGDVPSARVILDGDYGDLNEAGYYPYAVIECFRYGLYPLGTEPEWYEYKSGTWVKIEAAPFERPVIKHQPHFATIG